MTFKLQAVCFDLDGTLVDSMDMHMTTLCQMLKNELGMDRDPEEMKIYTGIPTRDILAEIVPADQVDHFAALWLEYELPVRPELKLFPGISERLANLKNAGLRLGVVTSQNRTELALFRKQLGLEDCMDIWISSDDTAHPKPAADPVLAAAGQFDCPPQEIVMIGDTIFDLQAGKAAGARAGAAFWGFAREKEMLAEQPDFVFRTVQDLDQLISQARNPAS
ncbi:MAG: HAD family hydrolase [Anaerolineaceae bacterium]